MPSQAVLGVDPGVHGGLALLRADGTIAAVWTLNPAMEEWEVVEIVKDASSLLKAYDSVACYFEKVGYIGGGGPRCSKCGKRTGGDGGQGAFTFGRISGGLAFALLALGIRPLYVYPQAWQAAMGCLSGGNKNVTKRRAAELFPGEKVTHASADALLVAEFGRRRCLSRA